MRCSAMDVVVYFTYLLSFLTYVLPTQAQEFCNGKTLWCDKGHCCGKGKCCAYYYELWWFWLIWALIILLSCCCLYQQKRFRRRQSPSRRGNRGRPRNRSRIAQALDAAFITPIFDSDRVRLPTYDEAKEMPKDPPPYNSLYETRLPETSVGGQQPSHNPSPSLPVLRTINDAPQASLIDNEEEAAVTVDIDRWTDPPPPYTTQATPVPSVHIPIPIPASLPLPNPVPPDTTSPSPSHVPCSAPYSPTASLQPATPSPDGSATPTSSASNSTNTVPTYTSLVSTPTNNFPSPTSSVPTPTSSSPANSFPSSSPTPPRSIPTHPDSALS